MTRVTLTPFERRQRNNLWRSRWRATHVEAARAQDRKAQALWRERHPAEALRTQREKRARDRARRIADGWVPKTRVEVAKMGQAAWRAHRDA